jgi:hypothetical protein
MQTPLALLARVGQLVIWLALLSLTACQKPLSPSTSTESAPPELIKLDLSEREHLRRGMRAYLDALAGITIGLGDHDRKAIAKHAHKVGMGAVKSVSLLTITKLPPPFLLMATDTHQKFDELAELADKRAGRQKLTEQLSDIMGNCSGCHSLYGLARR